jgi:hypothetical protein
MERIARHAWSTFRPVPLAPHWGARSELEIPGVARFALTPG